MTFLLCLLAFYLGAAFYALCCALAVIAYKRIAVAPLGYIRLALQSLAWPRVLWSLIDTMPAIARFLRDTRGAYLPAKIGLAAAVAWLAWKTLGSKSAAGAASAAGDAAAKGKKFATDEVKAIQATLNTLLKAAGKPTLAVDGKAGAMTCRAAEWLVANVPGCPQLVKDFAVSSNCGYGRKRAPCGVGGPTAPQSVREQIIAAGVAKGYPASDVNKAISRESGWHAQALNCQGADKHPVAGGLNGMLTSVLNSPNIGFEGAADQFAALTAEEQLPYVLKFISHMPPSTLHLPGDFGLALFTPAYVGKPDDFVIYEVGTPGWEQNPGLREGGNGPVTAGKVRSTAR